MLNCHKSTDKGQNRSTSRAFLADLHALAPRLPTLVFHLTFSIITPSYNQLDWLRLCVASIRDQFGPDSPLCVEHIIQDAGTPSIEEFAREVGANFYREGALVFSSPESSDNTRHHHISIHCESDGGMYDAVNRGLRRASGQICAYLNCDEQYLPGALARTIAWFDSHPDIDLLFADALLLDGEGHGLSYRRTVLPDRWHTRLSHLNTLTCSTFFRRSIIERNILFPADRKIIGDAVWINQLQECGTRMRCLNSPTSTFTLTGSNLSNLDHKGELELAQWNRSDDAPPNWLRKPVISWHRLKKALAGAYLRRSLEYQIYTLDQPDCRTLFHSTRLATNWPQIKPSAS